MRLSRQGERHSFVSNWPGSGSCGPVSFAQTCAWAPPVAPPSSVRGQRKWASHSSLCRSSRPQPAANKKSKPLHKKSGSSNIGHQPSPTDHDPTRFSVPPGRRRFHLDPASFVKAAVYLVGQKTWLDYGPQRTGVARKMATRTFWASSCLSKLTNPKPRDFPLSSVMTRILMAFPKQRFHSEHGRAFRPIQHSGVHLTIFIKNVPQFLFIHVVAKVFNINVCKLPGAGPEFSLALFAGFEASDKSAGGYFKTQGLLLRLRSKQWSNCTFIVSWFSWASSLKLP